MTRSGKSQRSSQLQVGWVHPSFTRTLSQPTTLKVLVALMDQDRFMQRARGRPSQELFAELNEFYQFAERFIEAAGGTVIKFMGDAVLVVFPEDLADQGIMALLKLRHQATVWFKDRGIDCGVHVSAHFGEVTVGKMGSIDRLDVIGETVNTCATLPRGSSFSLSEEALHRLAPANRRLVRKLTPPVVVRPAQP